jgi:hypothetical protein
MIIRAGARSYIGTLWSVGKETARRAPKRSIKTLLSGQLAISIVRNEQCKFSNLARIA